MDALTLILIAILIVLVIMFIYAKSARSRTHIRIRELIDSSNGTFDGPAQEALEELNGDELTPEQHVTRGNIIRYNILQGRLGGGDLFTRVHARRVIDDYNRAIIGFAAEARAGVRDREFLIEPNIFLNQMPRADDIEEDPGLQRLLIAMWENVNVYGDRIGQNSAADKIKRAVENAPTRQAAIAAALKPEIAPDPQNVHDSKVNSDLREILRKVEAPVNVNDQIADAQKYISTLDDTRAGKATNVLDIIKKGENISTFGEHENRIFALIWARCDDVRNYESRDNMREAVIQSLVDCYDGTPPSIVCINGRVGRVLNSIALLDYDPAISGAMTFAAYQSMIMNDAGDIFHEELNKLADSEDPAERELFTAYKDPTVVPNSDTEAAFKKTLTTRIETMLLAYKDKFSVGELDRLREDALSFVLL